MASEFGPFELVRLLGRGGMAEVFLARRRRDPSGAPFVLKRIRPELATNESSLKRLIFEAQIGSKIRHENLVPMVELGRVGDCHYIVLDHVTGFSLKRVIDLVFETRAPPPVPVALAIGRGILSGLSALHEAKDEEGKRRPILHRDVTPSNVIIAHDGRPVLIDYGIAKDQLGPSITMIGSVVGTVRYMAPEHRSSAFLDARSDVFSTSLILWELLAAKHAWPPLGPSLEILRTVFDPPEVPDELRARAPADVLSVVLRGLECDREKRYRDAPAMLAALEEAAGPPAPEDGEQVRAWIAELGLSPDEALDAPAIDAKPAIVPREELTWSSRGQLRPPHAPSLPPGPASPPPAGAHAVITIPPLPPRRDVALTSPDLTGDIRREVAFRQASMAAGAGVALVALALFLHFVLHVL